MPSPPRDRFTLIDLPVEKRRSRFAHDVKAGLSASPKTLPCCYFYARLGSRLFEAICELPEYYLTRAETAILQARASEIAALFSGPIDLIELGSGSAVKTRLLIEALLRQQSSPPLRGGRFGEIPGAATERRATLERSLRYVPLDICRTVLEETARDFLPFFPDLEILAIAGEYHEGLEHFQKIGGRRKLVLWLGSNIGNLQREEAAQFLGQVRATLAPEDRLVIGIDLRKDRSVLEAAYDDSCGVTAAFNRNLLARVNRELGGDFDLSAFRHRAVYNEQAGRVEMYLVSALAQKVKIDHLGLEVSFAEDEAIHTENSYKYSPEEIESLATAANLDMERAWLDSDRRFQLSLFKPAT
jgi:dimethylhistidine N-methyltransferase